LPPKLHRTSHHPCSRTASCSRPPSGRISLQPAARTINHVCSTPIPLWPHANGTHRRHQLAATFHIHTTQRRCLSPQQSRSRTHSNRSSHTSHLSPAPLHASKRHVDAELQAGPAQAARHSGTHRGRR
jgi:hypothetical protein